jgi:hypothetical protein
MRSSLLGTTGWVERGLAHHYNDGRKKEGRPPLGKPALWFSMEREYNRKEARHRQS